MSLRGCVFGYNGNFLFFFYMDHIGFKWCIVDNDKNTAAHPMEY